jgi:hypothetical protein
MDDAPHADAETGLYDPEEDGKHESKTFAVSLHPPSWTMTDVSFPSRPLKRFLGNPNTRQYSTFEPSTNPTMPFDKNSGDNTLLNTM